MITLIQTHSERMTTLLHASKKPKYFKTCLIILATRCCSKTTVISQQPKHFPLRLSKAKLSQADTPLDKLSYATRNGMH